MTESNRKSPSPSFTAVAHGALLSEALLESLLARFTCISVTKQCVTSKKQLLEVVESALIRTDAEGTVVLVSPTWSILMKHVISEKDLRSLRVRLT